MAKPPKPKIAGAAPAEPTTAIHLPDSVPVDDAVTKTETAPAAEAPTEPLDPADFGLTVDYDGLVSLEMLVSMEGPNLSLTPKSAYRCDPQQACRFARAEIARQGTPKA